MKTDEIKRLKEMYSVGTKIKLIRMDDHYSRLPKGCLGVVKGVDDIGQIHMIWENGSSLALISDIDEFEVID